MYKYGVIELFTGCCNVASSLDGGGDTFSPRNFCNCSSGKGFIGGSSRRLPVCGVVAGAVRAEIAVALVLEAVILAVFLHGEDHGAVGGSGLAVRDGGCRLFNGLRIVSAARTACAFWL